MVAVGEFGLFVFVLWFRVRVFIDAIASDSLSARRACVSQESSLSGAKQSDVGLFAHAKTFPPGGAQTDETVFPWSRE